MQVKSRGVGANKGADNVYFCATEKDFLAEFEKISSLILTKNDVNLWYNLNGKGSLTKDEKFEIAQMQLFVVIISSDFLDNGGRRDEELTTAISCKVPVLPILTERGIESDFNKKYGNIQLIADLPPINGEIPFEQKLQSFLSKTLTRDEINDRVKKEFAGSIFLSYRKKDRIEAQRLMKLIHQNEECRDFSIWYDEFLIPGENFDAEISARLENSDIFALAVTPNLLESGNYVLTTEYPTAKEKEKTVFPVEMQKTDLSLLKSKFVGLNNLTSAENGLQFRKNLLDVLQGVGGLKDRNSPEHLYYMGVAYMYGIGVEKDYEHAHKLLEKSAKSTYSQAYSLLSDAYWYGMGVSVDSKKSISYCEKFVEIKKAEYEKCKTEENLISLSNALKKLVDLYLFDGLDKSREKCYESKSYALKVTKSFADQTKKGALIEKAFWLTSIASDSILDSLFNLSTDEKIDYLKQAIKIYHAQIHNEEFSKTLDFKLVNHDYDEDIAFASYMLASICYGDDRYGEALSANKTASSYYSNLKDRDMQKYGAFYLATQEIFCYLAFSQNDESRLLLHARERYNVAKTLFKFDARRYSVELVSALDYLTNTYYDGRNYADMEMVFLEAVDAFEKNVNSTVYERGTLADVYCSYAWKLYLLHRFGDGLKYYGKAIEILEELYQKLPDEYGYKYGDTLNKASRCYEDKKEGVLVNEKACKVMKAVTDGKLGTVIFGQVVFTEGNLYSEICNELYNDYMELGDFQKAKEYLEIALQTQKDVSEIGDSLVDSLAYFDLLLKKGDLYNEEGDCLGALTIYQEALKTVEKYANAEDDFDREDSCYNQVKCWLKIAETCCNLNDYTSVVNCYGNALGVLDLIAEGGGEYFLYKVAEVYEHGAEIFIKMKKKKDALDYIKNARSFYSTSIKDQDEYRQKMAKLDQLKEDCQGNLFSSLFSKFKK